MKTDRIVGFAAPFLISFLMAPLSCPQEPPPAASPVATRSQITFHFDRPGLSVPSFSFNVREDGTGTYTAAYGAENPREGMRSPPPAVLPSTLAQASGQTSSTRPLMLSASTAAKLFALARSADRFRIACASKAKNIADTGTKTLSYQGSDGTGTCTYNYAENKAIVELTTTFQAMAFTLDAAHRLDLLHRFDRLGLDQEMAVLTDAASNGRAIEMANIAPSLHSLIEDEQVLERVRMRAAKLLQQSPASR